MDRLITVKEFGGLLGLKPQATHDLINREGIPRVELSKRAIRIRESDADAYLKRVTVRRSQ